MPYKAKGRKKEYMKEYVLKNKERLQEHQKKRWVELKRDLEKYKIYQQKIALYSKAYRAKNRQKILEKNKQYYEKRGSFLKKEEYKKILNDPVLHKEYLEKRKILERKRRNKNREWYNFKSRTYQRKRYLRKREEILAYNRDYRRNKMKPETKEKILKNQREWDRKQKVTNPAYKIKYNIKSRLGLLLKKQKITKRERTLDYVGCSFEDLKNHLEKQFQPGMSWENRVEWHIDHIVPVNYFIKNFDFTDINVQKKCFHYTNLRPLWKFDNLSKGAKIISGDITSPKM